MSVFTVTTANWDDPSFWSAILLSGPGNKLDFSNLPDGYVILFEPTTGLITIDDGTTSFVIADSTASGGPYDATLGGSTTLEHFDTIMAGGSYSYINGENGSDTLYGSANADDLAAGWSDSSDDVVFAGGGGDYVSGGGGNDGLYGEDGEDWIEGGWGDDWIYGGNDNDRLVGDRGNDLISGDAGDDILQGGEGSDTLLGGDGSDAIYGNYGDVVDGGEGGTDFDTLLVYDVDYIDYATAESGTVHFNDGSTLSFSNIEAVTELASDGIVSGTSGDDNISGLYVDADGDWGDGWDALGLWGVTGDGDYILAGDGNDSIWANLGDDIVYGEGGNDFIESWDGNDTLYGGTGDDYFVIGWNQQTAYGEDDADTFEAYNTQWIDGGSGGVDNDTLIAWDVDYVQLTAVDSNGNGWDGIVYLNSGDTITFSEIENFTLDGAAWGPTGIVDGTNFSEFMGIGWSDADGDQIDGADGNNDIIFANDGDDNIESGYGDDLVYAGAGNDNIDDQFGISIAGTDTIYGGAGNDTMWGGQGNDQLYGEADNDFIYGEEGDDTIDGGTGNDTIDVGTGGADTIVFSDGGGSDSVSNFQAPIDNGDGTFTGVDRFDVSGLTSDGGTTPVNVFDVTVSDDGSGNAVLSFPGGETVKLVGVAPSAVSSADQLIAMGIPDARDYMVEGTAGSDIINTSYSGDPEGDRIDNGDAADGSNDDVVYGYDGNDQFYTGAGSDSVYGGTGWDTMYLSESVGDDYFDGGGAEDDAINAFASASGWTVTYTATGAGTAVADTTGSTTTFVSVETVFGSNQGDVLDASLDAGGVYLEGYAGNDVITGGAGDDIVYGGSDNDVIDGGVGNDSLNGEDGADSITGGDGFDTIYGGTGNDTIDGGAGRDTIYGGGGADLLDGGDSDDLIYGGDGNDTLIGGAIGLGTGDTLYGDAGNDVFHATAEAGTTAEVYGGTGNDTINLYVSAVDPGGAITVDGGADVGDGDLDILNFYNTSDTYRITAADITLTGNETGTGTLTGLAPGDATLTFSEIEVFRLSTGDDRFDGSVATGPLNVAGYDGSDTITGGSGNDILSGGADADIFRVQDGFGSDTIYGGDTVTTGSDFDTIDLGALTVPVTVSFTGDGGGTISDGVNSILFTGIERLILPAGDDVVSLVGDTTGIEIWAGDGADEVTGGAGNDTVFGFAGNDTIRGGGGNDSLDGDAGNDSLLGGDGADTLIGDGGDDTLSGEVGDDVIYAGDGWDAAYGGDGNDAIYGEGDVDWLVGGAGNDTIYGGTGTDYIFGGTGDDLLVGEADSDSFNIGENEGADTIIAGETGDDTADELNFADPVTGTGISISYTGDEAGSYVYGTGSGSFTGIELLKLAEGDDTVDASADSAGVQVWAWGGNDSIIGGSGDDMIGADAGDDTVFGGGGADWIIGGDGNDLLSGDGGNDVLQAGAGVDTLAGGIGNDTLNFNSLDGEVDTIVLIDGGGADRVEYFEAPVDNGDGTFTGADRLDVSGLTSDGGTTPVTVYDVTVSDDGLGNALLSFPGGETVKLVGVAPASVSSLNALAALGIPDPRDFVVEGTAAGDIITGTYTGDPDGDMVDAGDAADGSDDDVIYGYAGNDIIDGGAGDDAIYGGDDNDQLYGSAGADTLDGGAGNDALYSGTGDDSLLGGDGNDTIFASSGADYIDAGAGNDDIRFTDADTVLGGDGDDMFRADALVLDGTGISITGGEGAETAGDTLFSGTYSGDVVVDLTAGGTGADPESGTMQLGTTTVTFAEIENIRTGAGNDTITGSSGGDVVAAGAGADLLSGNDGNDALSGEAGNDVLAGGAGADTLDGGADSDTLTGGTGDDVLTGGLGEDVFVFADGDGADTIADFDFGDDDANGFTNDQLDVAALTDGAGGGLTVADVTVTDTVGDGSGDAVLMFPTGASITLSGVDPATLDFATLHAMGIPCFTPGTLILTPRGEVPVETLRPGDGVVTRDNGVQIVRWVGQRRLGAAELMAHPELRPVVIRKGAFGNRRRMRVSPQHGLLLATDAGPRLVRARHVAEVLGGGYGRIDRKVFGVTYVHVMFDRHELVFAEGAVTESFYPGPMALRGVDRAALGELLALFPELAETWAGVRPASASYDRPALGYLDRGAAQVALAAWARRPEGVSARAGLQRGAK
ncbi:MAG: Hint domain-containing protein [Maritimibacter sp.]|nr:Hint domain-containing protein [Maritimibacter sp.]